MGLPSKSLPSDWELRLHDSGFSIVELEARQTDELRERFVEISKDGMSTKFLIYHQKQTDLERICAFTNLPEASSVLVDDLFATLEATNCDKK